MKKLALLRLGKARIFVTNDVSDGSRSAAVTADGNGSITNGWRRPVGAGLAVLAALLLVQLA
jgi:hypothetical protein